MADCRLMPRVRVPSALTLLCLVVCSSLMASCSQPLDEVVIHGETFTMEFAITEEEVTRGMGGRDHFPDGGGMLFIFSRPEMRVFHMKDCLIDIDIIFLDSRGIVTAVHEMKAEPLRGDNESERDYENRLAKYSSRHPAQFAIEVEAGTIRRLNVQVEDRVEMDLEGLKALAR
jgi:uncharacterized membrane protein (UPF0127 family)